MADQMVGLFFGEKMRQKKVTCEYCAEEHTVRASSKGPFYCGEACKQMRHNASMLGETLSIDRKYVDIEEDPMWKELSITTALSEEDELRAQRQASIEAAQRKNQESQRKAMSGKGSKFSTVYKFSGDVYKYYEPDEYKSKRDTCFIHKRILKKELDLLFGA